MPPCPDFHYTPDDIAASLLEDIEFQPNEIILEPCKGRGSQGFYKALIARGVEVEWCESDEGRDFFEYHPPFKYSKVITNPPYQNNGEDGERYNIVWPFMQHCFELCGDECWLLLNLQMLNSLTPKRLAEIKDNGFAMTHMRVLNIKQWRGRYYWICFKKGADSMIRF